MSLDKKELRSIFKKKRDEFCLKNDPLLASRELSKNLFKVLPKEGQGYWASYRAFQGEIDPCPSERIELKWCYPIISDEDLLFYENKLGQWVRNSYQIEEPVYVKGEEVLQSHIEGMLIPGLAFDLYGNRLGRGKAYYDRFLKKFKGIKIGIAYSVQVTELLPTYKTDIPMDYVVTEKEVHKALERKVS